MATGSEVLSRVSQPLEVQGSIAALRVHLHPYADALANFVSAVSSPPVLAAVMITVAAVSARRTDAWFWAVVDLAFSVVAPFGYLLWLFRRRMVSDLDGCCRQVCFRPLSFTLATTLMAVIALAVASAPPLLLAVAGVQLVQVMLMLSTTLPWKVSGRSVAVGAWVTFLFYNLGYRAWPALVALPFVVWSHIHLHRHTSARSISGVVWGGLMTWLMLLLVS